MAQRDVPLTKRDVGMLLRKGEQHVTAAEEVLKPHLKTSLTKQEKDLLRFKVISMRSSFEAFRSRQGRHAANNKILENAYFDAKITLPTALLPALEPGSGSSKQKMKYQDKGARAQRKEVADVANKLHEETTPILHAIVRLAKKRGLDSVAKIVKETTISPGRPEKMIKRLQRGIEAEKEEPFTGEEALALILQLGFTREKYQILRCAFKAKGYKNALPSYAKVLEVKEMCRPPKTETGAPVSDLRLFFSPPASGGRRPETGGRRSLIYGSNEVNMAMIDYNNEAMLKMCMISLLSKRLWKCRKHCLLILCL